jgi:ABC-type transport system substrate-binding protein
MTRRDRYAVFALFIALAIVGAAMVIPSHSSGPTGSSQTAVLGGPFREGVIGHPSSINPLTARSQADQDLVALLFRGRTRAGPDGTVVPDLATWSVSDDGRTYTFFMSQDAYWEDGQRVTAGDVVFTIGLLQNAAYDGPVGSSWQGIRATADDNFTVHFTMTLPIAGFLRQAELPILPSHLLSNVSVVDLADSTYSSRPVGDGPYRILELDYAHALLDRVGPVADAPALTASPAASPSASSSPLVFATVTPVPTKAPSSPNASEAPTDTPTAPPTAPPTPTPLPTATPTPVPLASGSYLTVPSQIELDFYDDSTSAAADFKAGKLDAVGGLTPDQTDAALTTAGSRLIPYRWASLLSVVVNERPAHPELRDANARTGLLAGIDRQSLLTKVLEGRGSTADYPIPNWSRAYDPDSVTATPYDPTAAEGYMSTAGWQGSSAGLAAPKASGTYTMELLTLDEASNADVYRTAQFVASAWRAMGLTVQVDAVPFVTYMSRLNEGDFSAAIAAFEVGLDPDLGPLLLSSQIGSGGSNVSGLQDNTLDQLLLTVRKTTDLAARADAVSALEKYISTTLPILPLAFRDYDLVVSSRVYDLASNEISDPSGRFWDVIDWRLASDR